MISPSNYIHVGYKLLLNKLSRREIRYLKPFMKYYEFIAEGTDFKARKKVIKINRDPSIIMKIKTISKHLKDRIDSCRETYNWYTNNKHKKAVLSSRYIYTSGKYKLIVIQGDINNKEVFVVMSKDSEKFSSIQVGKMAKLGLLGEKQPFTLDIPSRPYAFVQEWVTLSDKLVLRNKYIYPKN